MVLAVIVFTVYLRSPVFQVSDSHYSMLLSQTLVHEHTFALDSHMRLPLDPHLYPGLSDSGLPRSVQQVGGHSYYVYPPGSSILSMPFVAALNAFGVTADNADGTYSIAGETRIQRYLAALLMAVLIGGLYLVCFRFGLGYFSAIIFTLLAAFGTQIWSIASRGMWQHTWNLLLTAGIIGCLWTASEHSTRLHALWLATLLSWAYFVRPANAPMIVAVTVYVLIFHRDRLMPMVSAGAGWLALFLAHCKALYGQYYPDFYRVQSINNMRFAWRKFGVGIAGLLVSPSRGLVVFAPLSLCVLYLLIRYRTGLRDRRIVLLGLSILLLNLIMFATYVDWAAGHSYGARYMTDMTPWFIFAALVGLQSRNLAGEEHGPGKAVPAWHLALLGVVITLALYINGAGALSWDTARWNGSPGDIQIQTYRLWDWRRPQFLAPWYSLAPPAAAAVGPAVANGAQSFVASGALVSKLDFTSPDAPKFTEGFWNLPDGSARWSVKRHAVIRFSLTSRDAVQIQLNASAFLVPGQVQRQRVELTLNGKSLPSLTIEDPTPRTYQINTDNAPLLAENVLELEFPDAASPKQLGIGDDDRLLALSARWMEVHRANMAPLLNPANEKR